MKKVVKTIACVCFALCCAFMLTACGGGIEGTYKLYSVTATMGTTTITITVDEYNDILAKQEANEDLTIEEQTKLTFGAEIFAGEMSLILESNGVLKQSMKVAGEEAEVVQGTYTVDGETISMTIESETVDGTYIDGAITISSGSTSMVFKK